MNFYKDIDLKHKSKSSIGGKAHNLALLKSLGFNVPTFSVIPVEVFIDHVLEKNFENIDERIQKFQIPAEWIKTILDQFETNVFFAVRSSAIDEDGNQFSFAGQFESLLYVTKETLSKSIKQVWLSSCSDRIKEYRKNNQIQASFGIAVIIQQMIDADTSGVAFGLNPLTGNSNEKVISAVYGLGEGLVSGLLDADTYTIIDSKIDKQIALKTQAVKFNFSDQNGTSLIEIDSESHLSAALTDVQIFEVCDVLNKCNLAFECAQDIEFAYSKNELFLLQSRPITQTNSKNKTAENYILWDNSNIIESYPGVTTPLTFSFISKSYEQAYKLFSAYLGVDNQVINENNHVFTNTLGLINGRVYYNLKTWYQMLALLPGYSINARFMEKMMGVKERFDLPNQVKLSKSKAWWRILKMIIKMYGRYIALRKNRNKFVILLNETITEYKALDLSTKNAHELMHLYLNFEQKLLNEWKAPLLNDFFAMIWFGLLEKRCKKYHVSSNPNIHNDLLCGSSDIISTQPIHRTISLASLIAKTPILLTLFKNETSQEIWNELSRNSTSEYSLIKKELDRYISDFGERCIGELKLETVSYTQDPSKFIQILKSYVENDITQSSMSSNIEEKLRSDAENEVKKALKMNPFKKWKLKRTLNKARELVSSRENLRYERTRAFGIVREIFVNLGKHWYDQGVIEHRADIFYLTKDEIFSFIEGRSVSQNIKGVIKLRKEEYDNFKQQSPPSERFATFDTVYHNNNFFSTSKVERLDGDLKGIGCSPGRVKAKVRVVLNPEEIATLNGDILVTSSTDPGWVTLFPTASAIIVERGSLLSHSAIVSREMGIPCIVSVTGLLKTLKTGDIIEMDGSTGEIKLVSQDQ